MTTTKTAKRGRPAHEPSTVTRQQVRHLASIGIEVDDIAIVIGISAPTLRKHYWLDLQDGRGKGRARNTQRLHEAAEKGNVTAMIWLDKTRFNVTEPQEIGRKEQVEAESRTAAQGTAWSSLLLN